MCPATMPPSCRAKSSTLIHLGVASVVLCSSGTRGRRAKLGQKRNHIYPGTGIQASAELWQQGHSLLSQQGL